MTDDKEIVWTASELARFAEDLRPIDETLHSLASAYKCEYLPTAGRGWPGRRIMKRVRLKKYVMKLILNPNYLQDRRRHYELRDQWTYDFGEVYTKLLSQQLLATLEPIDLLDTTTLERLASDRLSRSLSRDGAHA